MAAFWFKSFLLDVDKLNIVYKIACYFMLYIKHIILLLFNCRCDSFVFRLPPTLIIQKVLFVCLYHIISVAIVASHCCCCYFIVHTFQISRFPASRFRFSQLSFVL